MCHELSQRFALLLADVQTTTAWPPGPTAVIQTDVEWVDRLSMIWRFEPELNRASAEHELGKVFGLPPPAKPAHLAVCRAGHTPAHATLVGCLSPLHFF